jgi:hypothetical protein
MGDSAIGLRSFCIQAWRSSRPLRESWDGVTPECNRPGVLRKIRQKGPT